MRDSNAHDWVALEPSWDSQCVGMNPLLRREWCWCEFRLFHRDMDTPHKHGLCPIVAVLGIVPMLGCATVSADALADSQAAVRAAEEVGADQHAEGQYHLKLAKDQIAEAKQKMDGNRDDKRRAEALLDRAKSDAELAIAYAQTEEAQREAQEAWSEVNELQGQ